MGEATGSHPRPAFHDGRSPDETKKKRSVLTADRTEKIQPRKPRYVPVEGHATVLYAIMRAGRGYRRNQRNAARPAISELSKLPLQKAVARVDWKWRSKTASVSGKGSWRAHGAYIARSHEWLGEKPPAVAIFDAAGSVDRDAVAGKVDSWYAEGDSRRWMLYISPDNKCDLPQLARDVMERVQKDLMLKLEWVAVVHDNTKYDHLHIAVRGIDLNTGRAFNMPVEYITRGFNLAVQKELTKQLGYDFSERIQTRQSVQVKAGVKQKQKVSQARSLDVA